MALPTGRLDIPGRQKRLLPGQRAAMGFLDGGRSTLPTVTHYTAELIRRVRDHGMPPERLRADVGETGFLQSGVAGGAAIDDSEFRKPDLLDSIVEVSLQCDGVSPAANQRQIPVLIVTPF